VRTYPVERSGVSGGGKRNVMIAAVLALGDHSRHRGACVNLPHEPRPHAHVLRGVPGNGRSACCEMHRVVAVASIAAIAAIATIAAIAAIATIAAIAIRKGEAQFNIGGRKPGGRVQPALGVENVGADGVASCTTRQAQAWSVLCAPLTVSGMV